ncbi:hypothetical protein [Cohnella boryungensis]|uniref:CxxxxCH/CxxCH domain-containing protein n=1 Tax=Cohnella boryungensis TaxID=768479 RepID=A0ABV8SBX8_9BACL
MAVSCPSGYTLAGSSSGTPFCSSSSCSQGGGNQRQVYVNLTCVNPSNGNVVNATGYNDIGCC